MKLPMLGRKGIWGASPTERLMRLGLDDVVLIKDLGVEGRILGEDEPGYYKVRVDVTRRVMERVPESALELLENAY